MPKLGHKKVYKPNRKMGEEDEALFAHLLFLFSQFECEKMYKYTVIHFAFV